MMTEEENLASGPETRRQALRELCGKSFIKVKKGLKASDIDIRRGQRVPLGQVFFACHLLPPNSLTMLFIVHTYGTLPNLSIGLFDSNKYGMQL